MSLARLLYPLMFLAPVSSIILYRFSISRISPRSAALTSSTSTITGPTRWGIPLKGVNSTRLGSTIKMRSWSGVLVSRNDATMELMQTLLPLPVAPAISTWGKAARSSTTGLPPVSWPSAMGRPPLAAILVKAGVSMTSRRCTLLGEGLGTSRPTSASPGTGASILRYGVFRARAMSFSRIKMLWTLTRLRSRADGSESSFSRPMAPRPDSPRLGTHPGTSPKRTILGPALMSVTSTLTPWSPRVVSTSRAIS